MNLVEKVLQGDRLALARMISKIEDQTDEGMIMLDELFPYTGRAHFIGVTGSPGSGKSSLVNQLVKRLLDQDTVTDSKVAVIAVDPTSPFSGGALLGDRIRMRELMLNPDVFIRSMASRGALGGLAHTTGLVAQVLDAAGYRTVIIETVGAGQTEVEIAGLAHTVLVVEAPGMGDDIQAIKAGILETADILVVNKSDLSGAERTVGALRSMLELARPDIRSIGHHLTVLEGDAQTLAEHDWLPPVMQTIATEGIGMDELLVEILRHKAYLLESHQKEQRDLIRIQKQVERMLKAELYERWQQFVPDGMLQEVLADLKERRISPQASVRLLLKAVERKD
jgi:LAO/AO transport system kinase